MLSSELMSEIKNQFAEKVETSPEALHQHITNFIYFNKLVPDLIFKASSEEDILAILNFCLKHKIPLIPYGSGTSLEGHTLPIKGGVCLDLQAMQRIIEFNPDDSYVIVEAGIPYNHLNQFLEPYGYYFPVEAGWGASIGGMIATNASGAGATDSGSMSKNVMGCNVAVYRDEKALIVKTGAKSPKTSAGYNLTGLLIGSEGTLGVITAACLKIRRKFTYEKTISCQFDDIADAVSFVIALKEQVQFRKVELMDKLQTEACLSTAPFDCFESNKNTILIELAGNHLALDEEVNLITAAVKKYNAIHYHIHNDKQIANEIWMMRKNAGPAALFYFDQKKRAMATDVCVPLSQLAACIKACYAHKKRLGIIAPLLAHIGDGNFHFTIIFDPNDTLEFKNALAFSRCVVEEGLKRGGTCTGEHGIGIGKIDYLELEHGDNLFLMKKIKQAFDPYGIFNPGKVFKMT